MKHSQQDPPWALVPSDVAEWMGMWDAVPLPETDLVVAPPAPTIPAPRSWRARLRLSGPRGD